MREKGGMIRLGVLVVVNLVFKCALSCLGPLLFILYTNDF